MGSFQIKEGEFHPVLRLAKEEKKQGQAARDHAVPLENAKMAGLILQRDQGRGCDEGGQAFPDLQDAVQV